MFDEDTEVIDAIISSAAIPGVATLIVLMRKFIVTEVLLIISRRFIKQ